MKKIVKKNKFFKIIPESNLVIGEMAYTPIGDEVAKSGVKCRERAIIQWASSLLGHDFDAFATIQGNAYCDERDEFDESIGIEVAAAKLDLKRHLKMAKRYSAIYRLLAETNATVYRLCRKHYNKACAIEEDLVRHYGRERV